MRLKNTVAAFLAAIFLMLSSGLSAKHVPVEKAQQVARNFFYVHYSSYLNSHELIEGEISDPEQIKFSAVNTLKNDQVVTMYIFNRPANGGYIIISADDKAFPVLNYAFRGNFDPSEGDLPDGLRWFIDHYSNQISHAVQNDVPASENAIQAWDQYLSGTAITQIKSVIPMTDSIKWDQGCYYNALCPQDNSAGASLCNRAPTGCVATAMGIVMRYQSYPDHGTGSESYNTSYGTLSANFGNAVYDWDNMPNELNGPNHDVATLLYHLGVSVNMNYGPNGSGAIFGHPYHTPTAEYALKNYFGYDNAQWDTKSNYTFAAWENRLRSNLDSLNPVIYAGGIHAFVCDGYQGSSNNYFHFNWGWGGAYNSYCYLNNIVPNGTGTGGGTGNYTSNQQAVFDMAPPKLSPQAEFTANNTVISPGGAVYFTDKTNYQAQSWLWEFGDGNTSTQQYPVHTYDSAGVYQVKLVVNNNYGADSITKSSYITVQQGSNISANIHLTVDTAFVTDLVAFADVSSGNPTGWTWDFGDGNYASTNKANHAYSAPGNYTIRLTAANNNGSDTTSERIVILPAPVPVAYFEADTNAVAAGTNARFYDLSANQPGSWSWDFGDGSSSSSQNPTHKYQTAGTYTVKLVVANSYGTDSITIQDFIEVYQAPPVADFIASKTTLLDGQTVQFIEQSQGIVDDFLWDFGDGNTSTSGYPTHSYNTPGIYTVSLTVSNSSGSDTITKTDLITVNGTGIEGQQGNSFKIYPNPANNILHIEFLDADEIISFSLKDISGKTVYSQQNAQKQEQIPVKKLNSGMYLLNVMSKKGSVIKKVIIR